MKTLDERTREVAELLLEELGIDDEPVESLDMDAPLFAAQDEQELGIGLDSVDALEIIVALRREYALEINDQMRSRLRSFSSIAQLVQEHLEERS